MNYASRIGDDDTIYMLGSTRSVDFMGGTNALQGGTDFFVMRLDADGQQMLYTTFIGGNQTETPNGIAVNAAGHASVSGQTNSTNLPTMNALHDTFQGGNSEYFVLRLDASGALQYASYYGGPGDDGTGDDGNMTLAPNGDVYITGRSASLPPNGLRPVDPYETTCTTQCAFVAGFDTQLAGNASQVYGTYVDGDGGDGGKDIALDAAGLIYVFGFTDSDAGLIDAGQAFQPNTNDANNQDNFIVKLDRSLAGSAQLVYSSYIGSPAIEGEPRGRMYLQSAEAVFLAGGTSGAAGTNGAAGYAAGFPIKNATQPLPAGSDEAYVMKLDTTRVGDASLVFSTFFGGSGSEAANDVIVDAAGMISVAGSFSAGALTPQPLIAPLAEFASGSGYVFQLDGNATVPSPVSTTRVPAAAVLALQSGQRLLVSGATPAAFTLVGALANAAPGGRNEAGCGVAAGLAIDDRCQPGPNSGCLVQRRFGNGRLHTCRRRLSCGVGRYDSRVVDQPARNRECRK